MKPYENLILDTHTLNILDLKVYFEHPKVILFENWNFDQNETKKVLLGTNVVNGAYSYKSWYVPYNMVKLILCYLKTDCIDLIVIVQTMFNEVQEGSLPKSIQIRFTSCLLLDVV